jgi:hypothetical protein
LCLALATARSAVADECPARPQDEIWLVSSRQVGYLQSGEIPTLHTQRYDPERGWTGAEMSALSQPSAPDQIVLIYVHGNRVESGQAASEGRYVYRLLTSHIDDPAPIRFVIWSWPSAQVRGQLRDVRVKAGRTDVAGYCLGWFLVQLPPEQRVSLVGYSFGARIVSGALHLAGGGQLAGRALPPHANDAVHTRVVMLAAAMHRNWLRPGGYHELAWDHLDYLLNLFNCCDPVLKRYPHLYKGSHAQALGFTGMYAADLGSYTGSIEQRDVCNVVDKSHAAIHYFNNRFLRQRMQEVIFWQPLGSDTSLSRGQSSPVAETAPMAEAASFGEPVLDSPHLHPLPTRSLDHG